MAPQQQETLVSPLTSSDAVKLLSELGSDAKILAGGTWIMRAPLRGEFRQKVLISLERIEKLKAINLGEEHLTIGSMATHHDISTTLKNAPDLEALRIAASASANPAVRRMATIGGNICSTGFQAADLVPALLALGARVTLQLGSSEDMVDRFEEIELEQYLATESQRHHDALIVEVKVLRGAFKSAHKRLLLRRAGEYPVANLSIRYGVDGSGAFKGARIFVGAVESKVKRWTRLEDTLNGKFLADVDIKQLAQDCLGELTGRDGPDAPGWYRTRVLPRLVSDAFFAASQSEH